MKKYNRENKVQYKNFVDIYRTSECVDVESQRENSGKMRERKDIKMKKREKMKEGAIVKKRMRVNRKRMGIYGRIVKDG